MMSNGKSLAPCRGLPAQRDRSLAIAAVHSALLLGFILHTLMWVTVAQAQESSDASSSYSIKRVAIQGNVRIDTEAIVSQLGAKPGPVSRGQISDDVKALYRTGFFDQVTVRLADEPTSTLTYVVVEKPMVRKVFIKGNKEVSESSLSDVFKFGSQRFLDKTRLDVMARSGVAYYQSRGFFDSSVSYSVVPVDNNQVDVTFNVKEGEKFKINEVVFRGTDKMDDDDLRGVIETKRYKWWSSWLFGTGRLSKELLENDRVLVRQYFLDNGFLDATISEPHIARQDNRLVVTFDISEGVQYKIGDITASGDLINGSANETLDGIKVSSGEIFSASAVRNDLFTISDKFGDRGYAFANVAPNTNVDRERSLVEIDFHTEKGKPVKVSKILIRGNNKTYDNVIRREMRIDEKEQFSSSKMRRSETVLRRTGYFEEVSVAPEPGQKDDEVNLGVAVKEGSTGSFSAGVGYSSFDGVILNARITEQNLFGTGRKLDLNADTGNFRQDFILSLTDPRLNDSWVSGGVSGVHATRDYFDFRRKQSGGSVTLGYPFEPLFDTWGQDVSAALQYEVFQNDIYNVNEEKVAQLVKDSEGQVMSSALTPSLTRNTIDNPLNPSRGSRQTLSFEYAGLGGDADYTLVEARNSWYYPLFNPGFGDFVFSWRAQFGYGESGNSDPFPLFRRYFPGGINSVRGYRNRALGPKDENGFLYGGSSQFINNLELIFPLVNAAGLRGVFFFDAGEAFDDGQSIDVGELRRAVGFGFRWASPMGPIRIEFGFPVDRQDGEKPMQTQFSFGAPW